MFIAILLLYSMIIIMYQKIYLQHWTLLWLPFNIDMVTPNIMHCVDDFKQWRFYNTQDEWKHQNTKKNIMRMLVRPEIGCITITIPKSLCTLYRLALLLLVPFFSTFFQISQTSQLSGARVVADTHDSAQIFLTNVMSIRKTTSPPPRWPSWLLVLLYG